MLLDLRIVRYLDWEQVKKAFIIIIFFSEIRKVLESSISLENVRFIMSRWLGNMGCISLTYILWTL